MSRLCFYAGVFLVTAATLMLQVVQTRILSVVTWYHLAFFVISIAMFGLTVGAVWVYLRRERFGAATLSADLAYFTTGFAVVLVIAAALEMTLTPVERFSATTLITWLELSICLAAPFFFSGVAVSLALTRSPFPIGTVYGLDLVGAAVGCLGVLAVLELTDGVSAVLWIAALIMVAAMLFGRARVGAMAPPDLPLARLARWRGAILVAIVALATVNGATDRGIRPVSVKGKVEASSEFGLPLYERWNSFSRVAVFGTWTEPAKLWGPAPIYESHRWRVQQRLLNIDGDAATTAYRFTGDLAAAGFLKYDITTLAYNLPDLHTAAIMGVGSGRDILGARVFGVPDITGVEINPTFIDLIMRDPDQSAFVGLASLGGIRFVVDEARSFMARSTETFDLIQMSLIDTWAATGAGAFSLSENGLYTVEAWNIFLGRLSPGGVFTVSRWHAPDRPEEMGRSISLAMAALFDRGVSDPRHHLFVATAAQIVTLVVSRDPLTDAQIAALERACDQYGYVVEISPNRPTDNSVLRALADTHDRASLEQFARRQPIDLSPATDDRPFFFNLLKPASLGALVIQRSVGILNGNMSAAITLLTLFLLSLGLVVVTILVPLRAAVRDVGRRLAFGGTAYFLLIGVGFMALEIGLLQRFGIFLGHPTYALSITLFSIIVATGIGSLISERAPLDTPQRLVAWAGALGGYILLLPWWLPGVLNAYDSATLLARAAVCVAVIVPAGVLMGFGFPTGMRLISAVDRRPTPWFWGINGAAGVLASSLAVACSIVWGISTTLIIGGACYLLLIPAALAIGFTERRLAMA